MIILNDNKEYYILIDEDNGEWCHGIIFEGVEEIISQFREYADQDDYDDDLTGSTLGYCAENWHFTIKKYQSTDFIELTPAEYDYKITKLIK